MQQNRFLMEFINMRKSLNQTPQMPTIQQASQAGMKSGNVGSTSLVSNKKQAPAQTPAPVMSDDITYKKIIEDKPPKADVLEYFRSRIEELKTDC
jgi:hypothetical protein